MASRRVLRLSDTIRRELADLLRRQVKDPRLAGLISVTDVETNPDLRTAKVYVSVYGTPEEAANVIEGLNHAAGYLRHELAGRVRLRRMPEIEFRLDLSIARGERIMQLLREIERSSPAAEPQ